jgi:hypothetical protein
MTARPFALPTSAKNRVGKKEPAGRIMCGPDGRFTSALSTNATSWREYAN